MSFVWDDATNARLGELHRLGHSASEIGRLMGTSKNSIVGKLRRLGVSAKPQVEKVALRRPPPMPVEPVKVMAIKRSRIVTFADLEANQCRWPIGDPRAPDFGFCGQERLPGRPYCIACTDRSIARKEAA